MAAIFIEKVFILLQQLWLKKTISYM